jgi:hypothetical protein
MTGVTVERSAVASFRPVQANIEIFFIFVLLVSIFGFQT